LSGNSAAGAGAGHRVTVRFADPNDLEPIVSFNLRLALETESKQLDQAKLYEGVAKALAEPERLRYWVAEESNSVVGALAISTEWSDWRNGWIWWLQSVYVVPESRGRGVFHALVREVRAEASRRGDIIGLRLYVERQNHAAQAVYRAIGLEPGGYEVMEQFWSDPRESR
jgi:GNAT superfamily N-acetyltransferase